MKKILLMAVVLMACLAVSCQKENVEELPTFTAHADNGGMKTDLVGNYIHWNNTDQVKVFGDFGYAIYGVAPRVDDPTWATLSVIENHDIASSQPYRFVYPASMAEGGSANNNNLYVTYPVERSINDAPLKYFPMYGESDHRDVAFRNLGGLVKIVLPEITRNINEIRISADEPISGTYRIGTGCSLAFNGTATGEDKRIVVKTEGRAFSAGDCVYIAVPEGQYHNFYIVIDAGTVAAAKVATVVNVQASAITTINISNLEFVDVNWAPATLQEKAFHQLRVRRIIFHYNYYAEVTDAERIDNHSSDPLATPIYKKIIGDVCHVYTPASEIYAPANSSELFGQYECPTILEQIDFGDGFNTSNVTNMIGMFEDCQSLTSLDLSSFNTSNVTNMGGMFYGCSSLTSLDLSSFNTSNVTNMYYMFFNCDNLTSLDLSSFNTSNVTDMRYMFTACSSLTSLDLSSFNTSNVTNMGCMFYGCSSLTSLNLSSFNTSNVTNMISMFNGCSSLTSLDLSSFNTSNVTNMGGMFYGCSSLTSLDLSSFNTSNVTNMRFMFYVCQSLTSLDLSSFSGQNISNFGYTFMYCSSLRSIEFGQSFTLSSTANVVEALYQTGSSNSTTTIHCNSATAAKLSSNTWVGSWVVFNTTY